MPPFWLIYSKFSTKLSVALGSKSNQTWLFANKCEIRIKSCFLRFSKSFGALADAGSDAPASGKDDGATALLSGDLLRTPVRRSTSIKTGDRLRERREEVFPRDEDDLCDVLRLDLEGELLGELLLRFADPKGDPLRT